jgi:hypothetical protein
VLFGGENGHTGRDLSDTWKFSGGSWTLLTPRVSPTPRLGTAFVDDGSDGYLLLYGGSTYGGPPLRETWSFHAGAWTNRTSSVGTPPPDDTENPLAYDAADGLVLLFGTMPATSPYVPTSSTYGYHGGEWTNLTRTVGTPPSGRIYAAMAYMASDREVVLFGGQYTLDPTSEAGDTWGFQGGTWTNLTQGLSPSNRTYSSLAYDPSISAGILMGGDPAGWTIADQWLWEPAPLYNVTFQETGLTPGTAWSVVAGGTANASSGSMIAFRLPNGTFSYAVQPLAGYSSNPSYGLVEVYGADTSVIVEFSRVYVVSFTETGLPAGSNWTVTVGLGVESSTTVWINFTEPNGSYAYTIGAIPGWSTSRLSGQILVDGAAVSRAVAWAQVTYEVEFSETGLSAGTSWSITLNGTQHTSTSATIKTSEPNGTYAFLVNYVEGYTSGPSSGNVVVSGASVTKSIAFAAIVPTYTVTFTETGLPAGTSWSVELSGASAFSCLGGITSDGRVNNITFGGIPNGSYYFTVRWTCMTNPGVGEYVPTPGAGTLVVNGRSVSESIVFEPEPSGPPSSGSTFLGLPVTEGYALLGGVIVAILAAAAAAVLTRRRGRRTPPDPPQPDAGDPPASP